MHRKFNNMRHCLSGLGTPVLLALGLLGVFAASAAADSGAVLRVDLSNGIRAAIYTPEYLIDRLTVDGSRGAIRLDDGRYLTVITDVSDPLIGNKGDGSFHPFDPNLVIELLSAIEYPGLDLDFDVYVLPFPRTNVLMSSVSGRTLYLSPQVREIQREGAAYIVAHEVGHLFQNSYMPDSADRHWNEYRGLRGIADLTQYAADAGHADRPVEIFAEDFRVLFGGPEAFFGGYVENSTLAPPLSVPGLKDFFLALGGGLPDAPVILGFSNFPNPFNPHTAIRVQLNADFVGRGESLTVRIYDVRGALVRELFAGPPDGREIEVTWDGRDNNGRMVASAMYFGVAEAGSHRMTRKLLMVK